MKAGVAWQNIIIDPGIGIDPGADRVWVCQTSDALVRGRSIGD